MSTEREREEESFFMAVRGKQISGDFSMLYQWKMLGFGGGGKLYADLLSNT